MHSPEGDFDGVGDHGGPSSLSRAGTLALFAGSVNRAWTDRRIKFREPLVRYFGMGLLDGGERAIGSGHLCHRSA